MPGGSVNGRPFRESNDSYQKSGVPCGNPKRFQSKEVLRMGDAGPSRGPSRRPLSGPVEEIETEGQRQLQQLLRRQLDTNVSVKQQISQKRAFQKSEAILPEIEQLSGVTHFSQFKDIEEKDSYIAELKHCGLTDEEIDIKLHFDIPDEVSKKPKYGVDPVYHEAKLEEIDRKIKDRKIRLSKPDQFYGRKKLTRHEMELEHSLIQDNDQSKLLTKMLTSQTTNKNEFIHPEHPMNNLPDILKSISSGNKEGKRTRRKNKQKLTLFTDNVKTDCSSSIDNRSDETQLITCEYTDNNNQSECKPETRVQQTNDCNTSTNYQNTSSEDVDHGDNSRTKQEVNKSRELQGLVSVLSEEDIIKDRLTVQEIKQLPRFENYSYGEPSNVLYLKNLSNKVTEEDLVSLFIRFEDEKGPKLIFRLMTGRMKGQAFITFKDLDVAKKALELANGYNLKGKPLIIQYGRKS